MTRLAGPSLGATKWGDTGVWPLQVGPEMAKHPVSPGFRSDLKWLDTLEKATWSFVECSAISGGTCNGASSLGVSGHFVTPDPRESSFLCGLIPYHSNARWIPGLTSRFKLPHEERGWSTGLELTRDESHHAP